jgi:mannobiose 2-epimerase
MLLVVARAEAQSPVGAHSAHDTDREATALASKIDEVLRSELIGHWYPHAVDRKRGGFHQNMARDWSLRPDENVSLVYQARMTWTAAAFAE